MRAIWGRLRNGIVGAMCGVLTFGLSGASAIAFSGYGTGSAGTPYYISSCGQLGEIANDLAGSYKLVRNIDCDGVTLVPIGDGVTPFTGTLDGQGFTVINTVMNVAQDNVGLFGVTSFATIKNLGLVAFDITGQSQVGTLAGSTGNTSIQDVRLSASSTTGTTKVGGLVGSQGGGAIQRSSATDMSVQGTSNVGGLVGYAVGPVAISDSYATGEVSGPGGLVGGLIGSVGAGPSPISTSYAVVDIYSTGADVGGLIGQTTNSGGQSVSSSFAASRLMVGTTETSIGGAFGTSNAPATDIWYDDGVMVWGTCAGVGSASCTAVNTGNSDPDYFKNSSSNGPFGSWDFSDVWQVNATDYPSLVALSNNSVTNAPNSNDANGDGVDDSYQGNVASAQLGGLWGTVTIAANSGCSVENVTAEAPASADSYSRPLGSMTGFSLYCGTAGATVPVTIIYDKQYDTAGWVLRHYNATTHAYTTVNNAVFGTTTVGGVVKTTVAYSVTDGGTLDTDGTANGIIVDPVIPGITGAPNTGIAGGSLNLAILQATTGVLILWGSLLVRRWGAPRRVT